MKTSRTFAFVTIFAFACGAELRARDLLDAPGPGYREHLLIIQRGLEPKSPQELTIKFAPMPTNDSLPRTPSLLETPIRLFSPLAAPAPATPPPAKK